MGCGYGGGKDWRSVLEISALHPAHTPPLGLDAGMVAEGVPPTEDVEMDLVSPQGARRAAPSPIQLV